MTYHAFELGTVKGKPWRYLCTGPTRELAREEGEAIVRTEQALGPHERVPVGAWTDGWCWKWSSTRAALERAGVPCAP